MKRSILFIALAAAGMSAMAQSSVTLYGRLNTTAEYEKEVAVAGSQKVLNNNASRWGLKGVEDLGGGLKAGFQIESGFDSSEGRGASALFGRQSEVYLSGAFGTVRLGNFTSEAYYATADYVSMHNHDTGRSEDKLYDYLGRNTNKIAYRTPEIAGFSAEVAATAGEGRGDHGFDVAANYNAGALHLGAGFEKIGDAKQLGLSALYDFGVAVVGGYYQRSDYGNLNRNAYRVAAMMPLGNLELHANYGVASDVASDDGATQVTVGLNYNLSKRTKVYTYYTQVSNDGQAIYGGTYALGADPKSFALGVRHNF